MSNEQPWNDLTAKQQELFARLTTLQQKVCMFLEQGHAPREAYYLAGGAASNHKSADSVVNRMLNEAAVAAFRRSLCAETANHLVMSRAEMRARLTAIARGSLSDLATVKRTLIGYDDNGEPQYINRVEMEDFRDAPLHSVQALSEISQKEHGISLKMHSALVAMKQLAELEGLEAPKAVEVKGMGNKTVILAGTSAQEAASVYQDLMQ